MKGLFGWLLAALFALAPGAGLAQSDDEAIPYSDEEEEAPPPRELPSRSRSEAKKKAEAREKAAKRKKSRLARERDDEEEEEDETGRVDGEELRGRGSRDVRDLDEDESADDVYKTEDELERQDARERARSLVGLDDPNTGVFVQLHGGLMLLDSPRGTWGEPRFGWGAKFTWEFGRAFLSDTWWRNALFLDVGWTYSTLADGTRQVNTDSNYHYYSVAPAIAFAVDDDAAFAFYFQGGAGVSHQFSALHIGGGETALVGFRPLFQYGLGFRGRPLLSVDSRVRLNFRAELTRLRRGYLDDTFFGVSLGTGF